MKFTQLHIPGVWLIEPKRFGDSRGYFMETYRQEDFIQHVGDVSFLQDNESFSSYGVVRGLHFQRGEKSQAKLVRVTRGEVLDVAVDLRASSPTFGQHVAVRLSAENALQLFIPRGFAHGFAVLSREAQFQYKVDNVYAPEAEMTLKYDDAAMGIDWVINRSEMVLSEKDKRGLPFGEIEFFD